MADELNLSAVGYAAGDAKAGPQGLEVTWGRAARVWWAMCWRCLLAVPVGAAAGCIIGGAMGAAGAFMHSDPRHMALAIQVVTAPVGALLGVAIAIWATRAVLRKRFSEFRIVLRPNGD